MSWSGTPRIELEGLRCKFPHAHQRTHPRTHTAHLPTKSIQLALVNILSLVSVVERVVACCLAHVQVGGSDAEVDAWDLRTRACHCRALSRRQVRYTLLCVYVWDKRVYVCEKGHRGRLHMLHTSYTVRGGLDALDTCM